MRLGFISTLPPVAVLPEDWIRPRNRRDDVHPAPWIAALLPELAKSAGYELRVFLAHRSIVKAGIVVRDGVEYEAIPVRLPERLNRKTLFYQKSCMLAKAVRRYAADLLHSFGFETRSALVSLRCGVPVSCFIQGIAEDLYQFFRKRSWLEATVMRWGERIASMRVPWMIAETQYARNWALRHNPNAKVVLIPHPLRKAFLRLPSPSFGQRVLAVGALEEWKGMDTVIRAFAMTKTGNADLMIVGRGSQRRALENLALSLGVSERVEFAGTLGVEELIREMGRAGVFVVASRADTSPNVLSEAHAAGLPVVGTRAGGIPEMIEHGVDGYHVEVDNLGALASRIEDLLSDVEMARRMGRKGREKVLSLNDPSRIAAANLEFFEGIRRDLIRSGTLGE